MKKEAVYIDSITLNNYKNLESSIHNFLQKYNIPIVFYEKYGPGHNTIGHNMIELFYYDLSLFLAVFQLAKNGIILHHQMDKNGKIVTKDDIKVVKMIYRNPIHVYE